MAGFRQPGPICGSLHTFDTGTLALASMPQPESLCVFRLSHSLAQIPTKKEPNPGPKTRVPKHSITKTDPKVWEAINREYGTRIDFPKVSIFEGGQRLEGDIPIARKTGSVLDRRGVTIATGFDIGQFSNLQIVAFAFGDDIQTLLLPYAGLTKDLAIKALAAESKKNGHGLIISKMQADRIDRKVKGFYVKSAKQAWAKAKPFNGTTFDNLTVAQQTVIFSRTSHQGANMHTMPVSEKFYRAAQAGDWTTAEKELRGYAVKEDWYRHRVAMEADLLLAENKK